MRRIKKQEYPKFCVIGAGHGGHAMAAHLALMNFKINLYSRSKDRIKPIKARGRIEIIAGEQVSSSIEGSGKIDKITANIEEAIADVDVLMVVVPATGHKFIAEICAPFLKDNQIIVLNPGRTGGALEFRYVLKEKKCKAKVIISEAQTLIYASRCEGPAQVRIFRIKNTVPLSALPAYKTMDVLKVVRIAYPQFIPADSVLTTSLDNIGAIFHPAITILNSARIESTHGNFEYYIDGITPTVAKILEEMDKERIAVGEALGIRLIPAREWLYIAYDAAGKDLYEAIQHNYGYKGIKAPLTIDHRYIFEDVPCSLVPIASLGEMLNVPTPTMKNIIQLASIMHQIDYFKEGRTVDRLGLKGLSIKEIRQLVVGK